MVKEIGLSLAGLGLLYLTRRKMTAELGRVVGRFGGGNRAFLIVWSAIFLPGTIIHEVSHFLAAALTGARTGRVEIFPELPRAGIGGQFDQQKKSIHLGYVQTQQLGLIRGFIVGTAPLFVGIGIMIWLTNNLQFNNFIAALDPSTPLGMTEMIIPFLKLYLFFTVANSIFPSWADIKHALPLIILGAITGIILYFSGINMTLTPDSPVLIAIFSLSKALILSVIINFLILLIIRTINVIPGLTRNLYK